MIWTQFTAALSCPALPAGVPTERHIAYNLIYASHTVLRAPATTPQGAHPPEARYARAFAGAVAAGG